jgi:circadian clock protein KaiB
MTTSYDLKLGRSEDELAESDESFYELTLFVSGASDLSARAIVNARQLCDAHLSDRYHLAVVDVHDDPDAILDSGVVATPTLVKKSPLPVRMLIGDLSDGDKAFETLELGVGKAVPGGPK